IGLYKTDIQAGGLILSVPMDKGALKEKLVLQTPEKELTQTSVINPQTVLKGTAILNAELQPELPSNAGSASTSPSIQVQKTVQVQSPLDLQITRLEALQCVPQKPEEPYVHFKDLLIRVYVTNASAFDRWERIEGITVKLQLRARILQGQLTDDSIEY